MNALIRAYVPNGTDPQAIENLMRGHGGYTTMQGAGNWQGEHEWVSEKVTIYECVLNVSGLTEAGTQLAHAGRVFLNDNRDEKAFLGVVIGDGVKQIYLEQGASE